MATVGLCSPALAQVQERLEGQACFIGQSNCAQHRTASGPRGQKSCPHFIYTRAGGNAMNIASPAFSDIELPNGEKRESEQLAGAWARFVLKCDFKQDVRYDGAYVDVQAATEKDIVKIRQARCAADPNNQGCDRVRARRGGG